jgi:hypothetical protein
LGQDVRENGNFASFFVNFQLESIFEKGAHQQAHLVLAGISLSSRLDVEMFRGGPNGQLPEQKLRLVAFDLVGEKNVGDQGNVGRREKPAIWNLNISRAEWKIGARLAVGLAGFDGSHVKRLTKRGADHERGSESGAPNDRDPHGHR